MNLHDKYRNLIRQSEELEMDVLLMLRRAAMAKIDNPFSRIQYRQAGREIGDEVGRFKGQIDEWSYTELVAAYIAGIELVNSDIVEFDVPIKQGLIDIRKQLFFPDRQPSPMPPQVLDEWQQHRDAFSILAGSTDGQFDQMRIQVVRDVRDKLRRLAVQASKDHFIEADTVTQRHIMDRLLKDYANEGITAVTYKDGTQMGLRGYTQMVSRTMVTSAARQGAVNRQMQIGHDLVRMDKHFPTCKFCAPWQGGIYSISGDSDKYRSLTTVLASKAFHPNCTHGINPYFAGISADELETADYGTSNDRMYELQSRQRAVERLLRKWKKREALAIGDDAKRTASQKVMYWQNQLEELTEKYDFLKYQNYRVTIGNGIHPRTRYKRAGVPWLIDKR